MREMILSVYAAGIQLKRCSGIYSNLALAFSVMLGKKQETRYR